jgi:hypothetical protein
MRFFPEPQTLEQAVATSQFANAWGVKLLIERCRQRKGECGGILIWKNADQWPCLDHGFYDYYGHPRAVVTWATRAFAPVAVSITQHFHDPDANLELWLVNDLYRPVEGQVVLAAQAIDEWGRVVAKHVLHAGPVYVGADEVRCLFTYPAQGFDRARTVFLASFESRDRSIQHQATYTLLPETAYRYYVVGGNLDQ